MWRSERSLVWNFLFTSYEAMNKLTVQARGFYKLVGVIQTLHRSQTEELVISGYTELRQGSTSDIWRFLDMPSALPLPSLEMLLSLPDLPPLLLNLNAVTHFYGRSQLAAPCRKSSCQPGGVSPLKPHSPLFFLWNYLSESPLARRHSGNSSLSSLIIFHLISWLSVCMMIPLSTINRVNLIYLF